MKQLARIIKNCGHRGKVGQVYEVIETNPREGFRLIMPGETQFSFWYPKDCIEEVQPGACTVPTTEPISFKFAWHLDKVTESITSMEASTTTGISISCGMRRFNNFVIPLYEFFIILSFFAP